MVGVGIYKLQWVLEHDCDPRFTFGLPSKENMISQNSRLVGESNSSLIAVSKHFFESNFFYFLFFQSIKIFWQGFLKNEYLFINKIIFTYFNYFLNKCLLITLSIKKWEELCCKYVLFMCESVSAPRFKLKTLYKLVKSLPTNLTIVSLLKRESKDANVYLRWIYMLSYLWGLISW